ncbi:MAG: ferritin family protein [Leptospiraceae bacterium]|nr:ferritin family protein [Leptospiraceae bacterium]MCB1320315.1 ferritin family protein [Leptospiraceae bacterium]
MAKIKPVKKTTFLEAVAAAIQHEKNIFDFYLRNAEDLPEGPVKQLFYQLAEDVEDHIEMIKNLYSEVEGGQALPNLKMLSAVHKFHSTSLSILMRRLDRITEKTAAGNEIETVALATRQLEDTADFYKKVAGKFEDPNIRGLFHQLGSFQEENRLLLESYSAIHTQGTPASQPSAYWEEDLNP